MTALTTNEFINTVSEIRKIAKDKDTFLTATYELAKAHCRWLAEKHNLDENEVSWGADDEKRLIFKHYTNVDTLEYTVLETV